MAIQLIFCVTTSIFSKTIIHVHIKKKARPDTPYGMPHHANTTWSWDQCCSYSKKV